MDVFFPLIFDHYFLGYKLPIFGFCGLVEF